MSVVIETTIGDITVDLYTRERPRTCLNFLKLCKIKYYNFCCFHLIQHNFIAQTGDPTGVGNGGDSVFLSLYGENARMFEMESKPKIKHKKLGLISMVNNGEGLHGSQFFITLAPDLDYLDGIHTVFGHVVEGLDVLEQFNEVLCDTTHRPFKDILITHTVILEDPYPDPNGLEIPPQSPEVSEELIKSNRIGVNEDIDETEGKTVEEIEEDIKTKEARERALVLEMIGDIPDADVKPPENVLFVCKLNPVTNEDDLEVIFSRFGPIVSCEVIRDSKSNESLQYAFIEFEKEEDCEKAYFKMDNVLIDDRRIHVDFSQSVSKMKWDFAKGKASKAVTDTTADSKDKSDDKRENLRIKKSAFGQRMDSNYEFVYDKNEYQLMIPKVKRKHKSDNRSPSSERHRSQRSKRSRSRSRDREKNRDRDKNRDKERDRDRDRHRDHKSRSDERHSHRTSSGRDHHRRHRDSSPPRSSGSHTKSHRHKH